MVMEIVVGLQDDDVQGVWRIEGSFKQREVIAWAIATGE